MAASDMGTGALVGFGTSSIPYEILDINWSGMERAVGETTHLATTLARTYLPGDLVDPGELSLTVHVNADQDPIDDTGLVIETITLTFPIPIGGSSGATWVGSGFIKSQDPVSIAIDEIMTASVTIKWSGDITTTNAV